MKHYLTSKVGVNSVEKHEIMEKIFGDNGLLNANDSFEFENRSADLKGFVRKHSIFSTYYDKHLKEKLKENLSMSRAAKYIGKVMDEEQRGVFK